MQHNFNRSTTLGRISYAWADSNIFSFRIWDGWMYCFLYLIIPIATTWLNLYFLPNELTTIAGFYFALMINVANCFYDALGRWDGKMVAKKIKLSIMLVVDVIIFSYAFVQLVAITFYGSIELRKDCVLCTYFVVLSIAVIDFWVLTAKKDTKESALKKIVSTVGT